MQVPGRKIVAKVRRSVIVLFSITCCIYLLVRCINDEAAGNNAQATHTSTRYAGEAACISCHKTIYESHTGTRHFLTSRPASAKYIKGSFARDSNLFIFNSRIYVAMEKRNDSFYQVAYLRGVENIAASFDIVIGSGTKGQSYLHWNGGKLAQLPITYFTSHDQWTNSPGYPDKLVFNRPITSRCLECHLTYAEKTSSENTMPETFDRNSILYGISCEKCHGPGAEHVAFHEQHPKDSIGRSIINPARLSRQQNLDLCTLCHGGRLAKTTPSFSFKAGDSLSRFFRFDTAGRHSFEIDVHGNQYGLMAASKCFALSNTMTCNTCHSAHDDELGNLTVFSQRCMNCHKTTHKDIGLSSSAIVSNCIDCHMPVELSRSVTVLLQDSEVPVPARMRSHLIKVYPEETARIIRLMKEPAR